MKIIKITVQKTKRQVNIYLENAEWAKIYRFGAKGGTFYTEVSDNIPKSEIREIAKTINNSEYFKGQALVPKLHEIRAIEKELERYNGKNIKTVQEL